MSAVFSEDKTLRFELRRKCGLAGGKVTWVMFNPSTADEEVNDPTIRRVIDFSQRWGFGDLIVVNLLPIRTPDPKEAWAWYKQATAYGQPSWSSGYWTNEKYIAEAARESEKVICAFGSLAGHLGYDFRDNWGGPEELYCLGVNADGLPKHPLYVGKTMQPVVWS